MLRSEQLKHLAEIQQKLLSADPNQDFEPEERAEILAALLATIEAVLDLDRRLESDRETRNSRNPAG